MVTRYGLNVSYNEQIEVAYYGWQRQTKSLRTDRGVLMSRYHCRGGNDGEMDMSSGSDKLWVINLGLHSFQETYPVSERHHFFIINQ